MKGIIVLDGPDGTGKSSLAKRFEVDYGAHIIHSTWSEDIDKRMASYLHDTVNDAINMSGDKLVVLDRLWMSELCYAEAYRNGTKWGQAVADIICELYIHDALNVVCLPKDLMRFQEHFEKLKDTRIEMFRANMMEVYRYYACIMYKFKDIPFYGEDFIKDEVYPMMDDGNTLLYDMFEHLNFTSGFQDKCINKLLELQNER